MQLNSVLRYSQTYLRLLTQLTVESGYENILLG